MEFQDVIRKRRMVRSFESRALPREVVERILGNAQRAPSAGFSQGCSFLVLEGVEQARAYWDAVGPTDSEAFRWQDLFKAPLLIVCLSNKSAYLDRYAEADKGWTDRSEAHWPAPYWDIDTGMAALLILLGVIYLMFGFKLFKALVMLNAAAVGAAIGASLAQKTETRFALMVLFGFMAAALTWPLMKWAVAVMGALFGAILVAAVDGKGIPMVKPCSAQPKARLTKGQKANKKRMATVANRFHPRALGADTATSR